MALANLTIGRICLHEIQKRNDERQALPVTYGSQLLVLQGKSLQTFEKRIYSAFASDAQCMAMAITAHGPGSVALLGSELVTATDADFVVNSRAFADLLNHHQQSRAIPGGLVVVFDGTVGNPALPFFAVMKADLHEGFVRGRNMSAQYLDSLFLSPGNKLYKVGLFRAKAQPAEALPGGWSATLYDRQMSALNRDGAAGYFHGNFLGLAIPQDSAFQVRTFWEKTREFIKQADMDEESKIDLYNGLHTYLKVDQAQQIQVSEFAQRFMDNDLGDAYIDHMRRARVPEVAIAKDLSEVKGRLRLRRFRFPEKIVLSGPPEAITELVTVEKIDGEDGQSWTQITVRGELESQE